MSMPMTALAPRSRACCVSSSNAIRASSGGGRVDVRVEQQNGLARISVSDVGPGVPSTQLGRIFEVLALLPTVTDDVPFAARVDPRAESVLVVPRGITVSNRPAQVSHVMEGV